MILRFNAAILAAALLSALQWQPAVAYYVPSSTTRESRSNRLHSSKTSVSECLAQSVQRMSQVMTTEFFDASPVLSVMQSQCLKRVEIKESTIPGAGRGLFATTNIKSGTIITFYPAHALGIDDGLSPQFSYLPQDEAYFQSHPCSQSSYLHCTDQPLFQRQSILSQTIPAMSDVPLYLDVNPHRDDIVVGPWLSHMINDGAVVQSNSVESILEYYVQSKEKKNCIHIPWGPSPVMATVTTKKVKKGEELFTSYGGTYWLGVLLDVRGEQGVAISKEIQDKIQETALDSVNSMKAVSGVYEQQEAAMHAEFNKRK